MNRLIIIGNGFDLAHGLKTSYKNFIEWYWDCVRDALIMCTERTYVDPLMSITLKETVKDSNWLYLIHSNSSFIYKDIFRRIKYSGKEVMETLQKAEDVEIEKSLFYKAICKSIETKGWVDIEHEYYNQLKKYAFSPEDVGGWETPLHEQLQFLQDKLVEYLQSIKVSNSLQMDSISNHLTDKAHEREIDTTTLTELTEKGIRIGDGETPKYTMLLNFNYTKTADLYAKTDRFFINHIHGSIDNPKSIIFGYGDEFDERFKAIINTNNNKYLDYTKSVRYLESEKYRDMLRFIEVEAFQVYIMGHSCGNSDRTLLNTIFEHRNCVSIKPYYYIKPDGTDNYLELVQNIYRNFTDLYKFRDRVVNKTYCETL